MDNLKETIVVSNSDIDGDIAGYNDVSDIYINISDVSHQFSASSVGDINIDSSYIWNNLDMNNNVHHYDDININGKSLVETLEKIEERLSIFQLNSEFESRWEELKKLGDQYRELENKIFEQERVFNIIKNS